MSVGSSSRLLAHCVPRIRYDSCFLKTYAHVRSLAKSIQKYKAFICSLADSIHTFCPVDHHGNELIDYLIPYPAFRDVVLFVLCLVYYYRELECVRRKSCRLDIRELECVRRKSCRLDIKPVSRLWCPYDWISNQHVWTMHSPHMLLLNTVRSHVIVSFGSALVVGEPAITLAEPASVKFGGEVYELARFQRELKRLGTVQLHLHLWMSWFPLNLVHVIVDYYMDVWGWAMHIT